MQQLDPSTTTTTTPTPSAATPLDAGPQPLRLDQLQQVCGGSPRGGWNASLAAGDGTESPRGGW
jgi:hypothetical protein